MVSIYLSIYLSVYLSIYLSIYLSVYLSVYLSMAMSPVITSNPGGSFCLSLLVNGRFRARFATAREVNEQYCAEMEVARP